MRETEVMDYTDNSELVNDQLMGLAGGIMDLMEDKDPNRSGIAQVNAPDEVVEEEEEVAEVAAETPKADKYMIKWEGEDKEVDHAELLELAQKGFDYTKKTQKLAQEKNELSPYIGLANKIKSDPLLAAKISDLLSGKVVDDAPRAPKIVSDDPVEQLKYEMKQEIMAEMESKLQKTVAPMNKQQALDRVRMQVQADPLFNDVQKDIVAMVQSQPQALQRNLYLQLDQDPSAYLQAFEHFKKIRQSKTGDIASVPKPVSSKTKAPILESAGNASVPSSASTKEKRAVMDKKKAKALRSGDTQELSNWLLESGALEHLF